MAFTFFAAFTFLAFFTFFTLFAQVYGDVAAGGRRPSSTWATFADGHYEMLFCEAVLRSAREGRWVEVKP